MGSNNQIFVDVAMVIKTMSKGLPYSGLEWSCECHCGYEPEDGFEWVWPSKCNDRCSGDSNQNCGGSNALRIDFNYMVTCSSYGPNKIGLGLTV